MQPIRQPSFATQLVFLSPDADEVLESVEEYKVYVLGGIIDKQPRKN